MSYYLQLIIAYDLTIVLTAFVFVTACKHLDFKTLFLRLNMTSGSLSVDYQITTIFFGVA